MASKSVSSIPAEEETENIEQQKTELEMLQSIYTNRELTVLKDNSEYLVGYVYIYSINFLDGCDYLFPSRDYLLR